MDTLSKDPHLSDPGEVRLSVESGVAALTLARPRYRNAMTWMMYEQLAAYLEVLEGDPQVRVVLLRGEGSKALASGTDIHQFVDFDGERGVEYEHQIDEIVTRLATLSKPTVVAIEGYAVGGGMALAAACDLRYANASARIGIPVAKSLGNCLAFSTYRRLADIVGVTKVKELMYTGRLMTAEESLHCGFLTDMYDDSLFAQKVVGVVSGIASHAPLTLWATKMAFSRWEAWSRTAIDANVPYADVVRRVYQSDDFRAAVQARLNKEPPTWTGR